ncbi:MULTISPECIES: poly-gamma-glutamate hydrolase family protein [unclassified Mesorhizobium]|uniref:poly-gamma-glutamate hydrolase family protein n=1 Tax=unclassified Mesorhizobium TaxID=325217 RepID=UPI000FD4DC7A|nr:MULTISPECIES: poly-gamma-glutamate hydrolase family protein [unclassified Mesorhizobium]RUV93577.1 hypothetical protein EOA88_06920 [Mesorhizobium sp. M5C.F.Ca.IN.020.14.1.1]RUV21896.1 hypothetical protein EOA86_28715 [Mesorhizobium sp. M5C.F.Ca.IN.020.32.2.1]RWG50730.1 MAG: hypothetical protein EOQ62_03460 [Mesorhizobium sp.]RWH55701.1 MAG: hypothetical protein EOQ82_15075 [Mesorhizobium sp.]RWI70709.1 MAG: hypothetical protein EOR18_18325 [Mesorhizobium sp.]
MITRREYQNYAELAQHETEGFDYRVTTRKVAGSPVAIVAPHGGAIEFMTLELARSIAGDDHNFYAFEGIAKKNNWRLHITSHRIDEPRALELIAPCEKVLTVHGLGADLQSLQVGGRDTALRASIHAALLAAGFESQIITTGEYAGMEPLNICNRGKTGAGVQLEINAGLRYSLRDDASAHNAFVDAVRSAL